MAFDLRAVIPDDYPVVCDWWKAWRWPAVPRDFLSDRGLMVEEGGIPLCAAWIFTTNSPLAYVDWYVSNPNVRRPGAVEFLLEACAEEVARVGYKFIYSSVRNPHLLKKMERAGFFVGDREMVNLIRKVQ